MAMVAVEKRKRLEKWHYAFARVVKQVMKEHRKEIDENWERMKRAEKDYEATIPGFKSSWDENRLLMCAVGTWIILNGSAEQKRALETWVDNLKAEGERRRAA